MAFGPFADPDQVEFPDQYQPGYTKGDNDIGRIEDPPYTDTSVQEERAVWGDDEESRNRDPDSIPEWGNKAPPVKSEYTGLIDAAGKVGVGIVDVAKAATKDKTEDRGNGYGPYANDPRFPNQNQPGYTGYVPAVAPGNGGGAGVVIAVGAGVVVLGGLTALLLSRSGKTRRRSGGE